MGVLVKNELYKLFHSKRMLAFLGMILILTVGFGVYVKCLSMGDGVTIEYINSVSGSFFPRMVLDALSDVFVPTFVTLIIAFFVVEEYEAGTLKLLLLHGITRTRVVILKILSEFLASTIIILTIFVSSIIMGIVLWRGEMFQSINIADVLFPYLLVLVSTIPFIMIINFLGILVKNNGILIGLMLALIVLSKVAGAAVPVLNEVLVMNYFKAVIYDWRGLNYQKVITSIILHTIVLWIATSLYFQKMEIQK